ncbi:MAG: transposase [Phototrophicaceae bacterium]|jgi:transposase-like protein
MIKPTQFNEEYKRSVVVKAKTSGNVTQTARELGISSKSLYRWIKAYAEPIEGDAQRHLPVQMLFHLPRCE